MKPTHRLLLRFKVPSWPLVLRKPLIKALVSRKKTTSLPYTTVTKTGLVYEGNAADLIDYHVLSRGAFEPGLSKLLKDWAESGQRDTFVDVGANSGLHTAYWSKYYRAGHAFEPYPPIFKKLLRTLELNSVNNVTPHALGLSSANAECEFLEPDSGNCGTGRLLVGKNDNPSRSVAKIAVRRGDEIMQIEQGHISAIKVDVEGFEADVFSGFRERIASDRPLVVFELLSNSPKDAEAICANLPNDYSYYEITNIKSPKYGLIKWTAGSADVVAIPKEHSDFIKSHANG